MLRFFKAVWTGLEPATPCVTGMYSNQLNYQTVALGGCKYKLVFSFYQKKNNFLLGKITRFIRARGQRCNSLFCLKYLEIASFEFLLVLS